MHTFERPITCSAPRSSETGGTPAASLPPPSSLKRPHTASAAASPPEPAASETARLEGRTRSNKIVVFEGSERHIGQVMDVKIVHAAPFTLYADPAIVNLD